MSALGVGVRRRGRPIWMAPPLGYVMLKGAVTLTKLVWPLAVMV